MGTDREKREYATSGFGWDGHDSEVGTNHTGSGGGRLCQASSLSIQASKLSKDEMDWWRRLSKNLHEFFTLSGLLFSFFWDFLFLEEWIGAVGDSTGVRMGIRLQMLVL